MATRAVNSNLEQLADEKVSAPITLAQRFDRGWQMAKHYRWDQMARRVVKVVISRFNGNAPIGVIGVPAGLEFRDLDTQAEIARRTIECRAGHHSHSQSDLRVGKIALLNAPANVGWPIHWDSPPPDSTHLWRFHWHYHEFLLNWIGRHNGHQQKEPVTVVQNSNAGASTSTGAASTISGGERAEWAAELHESDEAWNDVWQVIDGWIASHPSERTARNAEAWHPYCISRRAPVWLWLIATGSPPPAIRNRVLNSLWQQGEYLRTHIERDLGGNHLLENLAALMCLAGTIKGPRTSDWLQVAKRHLAKELSRQILDTGEHFERTPAYHCQVLGNLLRSALLLKTVAPDLAAICMDFAKPMAAFLQSVLHPDGEIPLFGDSVFDEAPSVRELRLLAVLAELEWPVNGETHCRSDYFVFHSETADSNSGHTLIFDRGEVAPRSLPAHGHCDLLQIEASVGHCRWLVDSGTYNYENDSMRRYCRSSIAHNVVMVDGYEQCDVWSRFRMGRRGKVIGTGHGTEGPFEWASAAHNAYRFCGVPRMNRLVAANPDACWLCVDWPTTNRAVALTGHIHLAPPVKVNSIECQNGTWRVSLNDGETARHLQLVGCDDVRVDQGWYCPRFGERHRTPVITYRQTEYAGLPLAWLCHPPDKSYLAHAQPNRVELERSADQSLFNWQLDSCI